MCSCVLVCLRLRPSTNEQASVVAASRWSLFLLAGAKSLGARARVCVCDARLAARNHCAHETKAKLQRARVAYTSQTRLAREREKSWPASPCSRARAPHSSSPNTNTCARARTETRACALTKVLSFRARAELKLSWNGVSLCSLSHRSHTSSASSSFKSTTRTRLDLTETRRIRAKRSLAS